ncbi:restriction endonuclease subunit S [Vibrio furnissii]|uniref:restriction endonuclease subunit S n=1 Tax=Vibrio furnissii TaxID=29494 RepID=UPI003749160D
MFSSWFVRTQVTIGSDSVAQPNLNLGSLKDFHLIVPSINEQTQIANFLDHETAKIDTLIEKQQQLIKLLKEKRQAVISHAVTKGLNPQAPMKDSGVEWLGEVPEHWKVCQIKHTCQLLKDGTHLPPPRVDEGIPLLSVRNIIDGKFGFRSDDSMISERDYTLLCKSFIPQKNDVLLAIVGATLGKAAIVGDMDNFHIQRSLGIFRTDISKLIPEMLLYLFTSRGFQNLLWEYVGFSAQPGIYLGTLANFSIPIPTIDDQKQIISYCKKQTSKLDELISKADALVLMLQERRTALISAAVTGKIDVRNWQAPTLQEQALEQTA